MLGVVIVGGSIVCGSIVGGFGLGRVGVRRWCDGRQVGPRPVSFDDPHEGFVVVDLVLTDLDHPDAELRECFVQVGDRAFCVVDDDAQGR